MAHSTPKKGSNGTFTPFTPDTGAGSRARRARRDWRGRCGQRCPARLRHPEHPPSQQARHQPPAAHAPSLPDPMITAMILNMMFTIIRDLTSSS